MSLSWHRPSDNETDHESWLHDDSAKGPKTWMIHAYVHLRDFFDVDISSQTAMEIGVGVRRHIYIDQKFLSILQSHPKELRSQLESVLQT